MRGLDINKILFKIIFFKLTLKEKFCYLLDAQRNPLSKQNSKGYYCLKTVT